MAKVSSLFRVGAKTVAVPLVGGALCLEAYRRIHLVDKENASTCRYAASEQLLKAEHIRTLEREGLVVLENAISNATLKSIQKDVMGFIRNGLFSRRANGDSMDVRQDFVYWLNCAGKTVPDDTWHCMRLLQGVAAALESHGYRISHDHKVATLQQLAWYPGDLTSGYVKHFDHVSQSMWQLGLLEWLASSDMRTRCVTAILYLSDPNWTPSSYQRKEDDPGDGDGGELRCWVRVGNGQGENLVRDIVPRGGTLLIFDAKRIQHQVLSSKRDRFALTVWINGKDGPGLCAAG